MARVNINRTRSRAYARDWADENHVNPLAEKILQGARRDAPVRTGALRMSLRNDKQLSTFEVRRRVGSLLRYAHLVQAGAKPHAIRPRNPNGRLVFFWAKVNRIVKLKQVSHPGFKAITYLQRPLVIYGNAARFRVILYPA